jgi:hypothetical protein
MSVQPAHPDDGDKQEHDGPDLSGEQLPDYILVLDLGDADTSEPPS